MRSRFASVGLCIMLTDFLVLLLCKVSNPYSTMSFTQFQAPYFTAFVETVETLKINRHMRGQHQRYPICSITLMNAMTLFLKQHGPHYCVTNLQGTKELIRMHKNWKNRIYKKNWKKICASGFWTKHFFVCKFYILVW